MVVPPGRPRGSSRCGRAPVRSRGAWLHEGDERTVRRSTATRRRSANSSSRAAAATDSPNSATWRGLREVSADPVNPV